MIKYTYHISQVQSVMVVVLLVLLSSTLLATNNFLHLRGRVVENEKPIPNARVIIWENDSVVYELRTNLLGGFSLYVPFNREYLFSFSHKSLLNKKVFINTHTAVEPDPSNYYQFHFEVELLEAANISNDEIYEYPVAMVFYNSQQDDFDYYRANLPMGPGRDFTREDNLLMVDLPGGITEPGFLDLASVAGDTTKVLLAHDVSLHTDAPKAGTVVAEATVSAPAKSDDHVADEKMLSPCSQELSNRVFIIQENPFHDFSNFLDSSEELNFEDKVFFSIQLLATAKAVPDGFFNKITRQMPLLEILHYYDNEDGLDKYMAGVFADMDSTMHHYRLLRNQGYEGYIVAFYNKQRVRVKVAQQYAK